MVEQGQAARIVVVDDEAVARVSLAEILRLEGYEVSTAASGEEALSLLNKSGPFDLMVLDLKMPGMDGLEVTSKLRKNLAFNHTPIIALTAYAMKGDREKAISAGCDAYLSKPINTRQLPEVIAKMLLQRQKDTT